MTIDLEGTELKAKTFREINDTEKESDWIRCWVADCKFEGVGDPEKLEKILQIFLNWALSVN